jgi:hypothetical protein
MNPIEVVIKSTGHTVGWACTKCNNMHTTAIYGGHRDASDEAKRVAEECCEPSVCPCGSDCHPYHKTCWMCQKGERDMKKHVRYNTAPKLTLKQYLEKHPNGMLAWGDDEYARADCVYDHADTMPEVVWCCDPVELRIDADNVLESVLDEHHEDAYDDCDVPALQKLLDDWCAGQSVESWEQSKYALHPDCVAAIRAEGEQDE